MHYLVACSIMKNEERYIEEWLTFHHRIGVERFYIYDNGCTDRTLELIRGWKYADLVTVIDFPGVRVQHIAYAHMIKEHRAIAEWCAFIDADEFICPMGSVSVPDMLRLFSSECTGLYMHWLMFGSSGLQDRGPGPVTEAFVKRGPFSFGPNRIGKSVVKLRHATQPSGTHIIQSDGRMLNDSGEVIDQDCDGFHTGSSHRYLSLNHYFTKSLAEWRERRSMGRVSQDPNSPNYRRTEDQFHSHDVNQVEDLRAARIMQGCKGLY
jgi:hypothetical protein